MSLQLPTAGTTGFSKPVLLTHKGLLNNGRFVGHNQQLSENDVVVIPVPLFHCFGCVLGNLAALSHHSKIVYPDFGFNTEQVLKSITEEKATALLGVPTMFLEQLHHPDFEKYNFDTLRTGIMAGSICPPHLMQKIIEKMNMKHVTICYGLTECSPVVTQTNVEDSFDERVWTVGRTHQHVELKIVDSDGQAVPAGQEGELWARGYNVMKEYYLKPKETSQVLEPDGWLKTGDLAIMSREGFFRISGRKKDLIIRGGENISPKEIEDTIYLFPGVKDVAVIGLPDELMGEIVVAWCIAKDPRKPPSPNDIQNFCREHLAHYKVPAHVMLTDSFPLTGNGKIQKYVLVE